MPYLQLRDIRYPLAAGANRIARRPDADIRIIDGSEGPAVAVIALEQDGTAAVSRPVDEGVVLLNGVSIGAEPAPVLHGDRLSLDGLALRYADDAQMGDTLESPVVTGDARIARAGPAVRESRSQGRLVSLVDGREYDVPSTGLSIGRDATCDVVLVAPTVSRRHATVRATPLGYRVVDTSRNGVYVNDARVASELPLGRGDTVRFGSDEFRFYAMAEAARERLDVAAAPSLQQTTAFSALARQPVASTAVPSAERPVLAVLEITNEGPTKGTRHKISSPLAHVGRAGHNDVVIADESVSETHAKLQRRDDIWYLMDLDSTNGTYAAGSRLTTESTLGPGSDVRFGGVKAVFQPAVETLRTSGSTRVIAGFKAPDPKRIDRRTPRFNSVGEEPESAPASRPLRLLLAAALGFALYMLVRGGLR